jgi:hypothetical protein
MLNTHHKGKKLATSSCTFKPISSLSDDDIEALGLTNGKIGYGTFFEETTTDIDTHSAALLFSIYVTDHEYLSIVEMVKSGILCDSLAISFSDEDGSDSGRLKRGWEPDGSRLVWNYKKESGKSKLNLSSYQLTFTDRAETSEPVSESSTDSSTSSRLFNELRNVKYALYIVAFASLLSILSRCS